jgi:putative ABC transport system permease protein
MGAHDLGARQMAWTLQTLWFERKRYIPGILAVAFSALLIALQVGIFWGLISVVSIPIINSKANIWVCFPKTKAIDLGRAIPNYWRDRLLAIPEIIADDQYIQGMAVWKGEDEACELSIVAGCTLEDHSLGPVARLTPELRRALLEPGTIVLDQYDCSRLGISRVGQSGYINSQPVRVVGFVQGMGSLTGPYSLCSLSTARKLLGLRDDQTTFLLGRCRDAEATAVATARLNEFPKFVAFEAQSFALQSKIHWLTKTKAGVAVTFIALLGLTVGAVVTSQTLYAATAAASRELAVLVALGISRHRIQWSILTQAFVVGILGLCLGAPGALVLGELAKAVGTNADIAPWILATTCAVTLVMALASGFFALRSLQLAEPTSLLR